MSLMGTLAKVAIGVMVAKGVGGMMKGGGSGGGLLGGLKGQQPPAGGSGGIEDVLGGFLGGKQTQAGQPQADGQTGGLGGLLEQLGGGQQAGGGQSGGGLGDLLGNLAGGQQGGSGGGLGDLLGQLSGGAAGGKAGGGLGDLLGQLTGGAKQSGGAGGGLGDLLGQLAGGAQQSSGGGGSFGDVLNQAFEKQGEPEVAPSVEQEVVAALMLKAMIQAAKSDGKLDDGERAKLMENLGEISPAERQFVDQELDSPMDVEGLAQQVPAGLEQQVYVMSVMGIELDTREEAQYLHELAGAIKLDQDQVNAIHDQLGVQRLYA